jgi:hypothetical protein
MQTTVEWLIEQLMERGFQEKNYEILKQAKEMEKQMVTDAFKHGRLPVLFGELTAEQYYNETYGSKGSDDHISDISKMVEVPKQETMYKEDTCKINGNTYITNEEEIKKGDWFLEKAGRQYPIQWNGKEKLNFHCKKIILTTDQDLINDGVDKLPQQEISDDEIEKVSNTLGDDYYASELIMWEKGAKWYREQLKQNL